MALVSIKEASILTKIPTATLYRHSSSGKLKRVNGRIDTNELTRVYGEFNYDTSFDESSQINVLLTKIDSLQQKLDEADIRHATEITRLMSIIDNRLSNDFVKPSMLQTLKRILGW